MSVPQGVVVSKTNAKLGIIDCDFHNAIDSEQDLFPYLSQRWQQHIRTFGISNYGGAYYPRFMDDRADEWPPSGRRAGSEVGFSGQFSDRHNIVYAIINSLTAVGKQPNLDLDVALATASTSGRLPNGWTKTCGCEPP